MQCSDKVKKDKSQFVSIVLSKLLIEADTGWYGAKYEVTDNGEYVYLLTDKGYRSKKIDVTADSLESIVRDVFNNL